MNDGLGSLGHSGACLRDACLRGDCRARERASRPPIAELLGKPDDAADLSSTNIGEPVRVLVLHLANGFCTMGLHSRNDSIDAIGFVQVNFLPIGSRSIARVASTSPSPVGLPTEGPSTVIWPSSSRPNATKSAFEIVDNYQDGWPGLGLRLHRRRVQN